MLEIKFMITTFSVSRSLKTSCVNASKGLEGIKLKYLKAIYQIYYQLCHLIIYHSLFIAT